MSSAPPPTEKPKGPGPQGTGGPSIWLQLAAAFAVFLVLSAGYSFIRDYMSQQVETVPLSQIAADIDAGKITDIAVEGDSIKATYADKTQKTSRKESEASLTQTLADLQVPPAKLSAVKIEIKDESGARFWFLTLVPIIVPSLLLFGVI